MGSQQPVASLDVASPEQQLPDPELVSGKGVVAEWVLGF